MDGKDNFGNYVDNVDIENNNYVDNVDIENKNETDYKIGKYYDFDDDQTFESSGKVSKRAAHQADQRVVS